MRKLFLFNAFLVFLGTGQSAVADWLVVGRFSVEDCSFGVFCAIEKPDAVIHGRTVYRLPKRFDDVDKGPRSVGASGRCESTLGYSQRFAKYKAGDKGDPTSYEALSGRTATFKCKRID